VLQCPGKILVPGYVEPHTHITGMSTPEEFAREVLRSGTTTLVADTLQILLHTPPARVPQLLTTLSDLPVLILWSLRLHGASHLPEEPMFSRERIEALRSEEHTSELQSREKLVCRLLLEKKKRINVWQVPDDRT